MWQHCGRFILKQEIELLKPSTILILGKKNRDCFTANLLDDSTGGWHMHESVGYRRAVLHGLQVSLFSVPHPSRWFPFRQLHTVVTGASCSGHSLPLTKRTSGDEP